MRLRTKAAGLLAGLMVLASTGSALAAGSNYQPVSGGVVKFDKYLVMVQEANVPNQTFAFTIAPAASGLADANGKLVVQSGSASAVTGSPTIAAGQAAFSTGDTTYTTVQPHVDTGTQQATQPKDNVTLGADQKYARKQVAVDFSSVKFSEPGVYRWVVTETATQKLGINNDTDATRNLDV